MKEDNAVRDKSKAFAIRCIKLYKFLTEQKREYILSKQMLRSGTSIGANLIEGIHAQSRADFTAKLFIAHKEAAETDYWLTLLYETDYLNETQYQSISQDCNEIIRLLQTITKTLNPKTFN